LFTHGQPVLTRQLFGAHQAQGWTGFTAGLLQRLRFHDVFLCGIKTPGQQELTRRFNS
jgi:hypothetical protein